MARSYIEYKIVSRQGNLVYDGLCLTIYILECFHYGTIWGFLLVYIHGHKLGYKFI